MRIAGLQKTSTLDYPKKLAAVIFAAGCNYRCFYCHNRSIIGDPPLIDENEVWAFLEKRKGLLDAVVFTGGEPTLQKDLAWQLNRAKKLGYSVKLDTNGSRPEVLKSVITAGLADYVAMDYKAPAGMYPALCGAGAAGVRESLGILFASGIEWELRTTVVPQLGIAELESMARAVPELPRWYLQLYREQEGDRETLGDLEPYGPERIREMARALAPLQKNVTSRA